MENPFAKKDPKPAFLAEQDKIGAKKTDESLAEKPTVSQSQFDNKPVVITTEIDAYISEIMRGGPQSKEDIQVRDYSVTSGKHRLSLPDEIQQKYGKKYAFRWVNKKKDWIDRAISIRRWVIVNRVLFNDMPRHLFTANGTIENGDTILCFMPMAEAERLRREPQELSRARVKELPMEQWKHKKGEDSPFYKPTLGQEEKDGEVLTAGIQPDVQNQTE